MFKTPKSFDLEDDEGYMDETFSLRLPKRVEPMLKEMSKKGLKVGPKLRPHIAQMIETLYGDWLAKQKAREANQAS